jgi:hypothetical protein
MEMVAAGPLPYDAPMAKRKMPAEVAAALSVRERVLLFCIASGTDWLLARITEETVITMLLNGLLQRDTTGQLSLTDRGRAVLRVLLPDL